LREPGKIALNDGCLKRREERSADQWKSSVSKKILRTELRMPNHLPSSSQQFPFHKAASMQIFTYGKGICISANGVYDGTAAYLVNEVLPFSFVELIDELGVNAKKESRCIFPQMILTKISC